MKKIISLLAICFMSLFAFAGCGVEGSSLATGIEFVRDVFYVDYNVETTLDCKIYPSTAKDYYLTYEPQADVSQSSYFNFSKGKIKVINNKFKEVTVIVRMNDYTDTCVVKLKEYPTAINFEKNSDVIRAGCSYVLNLQGVFDGLTRSCENSEFNYKVVSSNTSIIEVVSKESLIVRSTGRRGTAKIDVYVCNSQGKLMDGLKASINLTVVESINDSFVAFGNDTVIKNGDTIELKMSANEQRELLVLYFSEGGFVNTLTDYQVYLSNNNVFEIVKDAGKIYLKAKNPTTEPSEEGYHNVILTIQSTGLEEDGEPSKLECLMKVQIL